MAMKPCRECATPVSTGAKHCPQCGKVRPTGGLPALAWIAIVLFGSPIVVGLLQGALGDTTPPSSPLQAALRATTSSMASPGAARQDNPPLETITAEALYRRYHANEVAADIDFKGRRFRVTGVADGISKDAFNRGFITIRSPGLFSDVMAILRPSALVDAARLRQGDPVALQCTGRGMTMQSPMLGDCVVEVGAPAAAATIPAAGAPEPDADSRWAAREPAGTNDLARPSSFSGHYRLVVDPGAYASASLSVKVLGDTSIQFGMDAGYRDRLGTLYGVAPLRDGVAEARLTSYTEVPCVVRIRFAPTGATIDEFSGYTCGFGMSVEGSGSYRKLDNVVPSAREVTER